MSTVLSVQKPSISKGIFKQSSTKEKEPSFDYLETLRGASTLRNLSSAAMNLPEDPIHSPAPTKEEDAEERDFQEFVASLQGKVHYDRIFPQPKHLPFQLLPSPFR